MWSCNNVDQTSISMFTRYILFCLFCPLSKSKSHSDVLIVTISDIKCCFLNATSISNISGIFGHLRVSCSFSYSLELLFFFSDATIFFRKNPYQWRPNGIVGSCDWFLESAFLWSIFDLDELLYLKIQTS